MTKKKERVKLTPPDPRQCQSMRPNGATFMSLGGKPGLMRCKNKPIVIATEVKPGKDGLIGSMSLCGHCMEKMQEQLGAGFCTFKAIVRHVR